MREIELLKEAMLVYGLSPERASAYIGADGRTVRRWIDGENEPTFIYRKAIVAGVEKMKAEFEPLIQRSGGAWWGNLSGERTEPTPEETAADKAALKSEDELLARIRKAGAALKASVVGREAACLEEAWPGFREIVRAMFERGIRFQI